jgi:hypothetical protein
MYEVSSAAARPGEWPVGDSFSAEKPPFVPCSSHYDRAWLRPAAFNLEGKTRDAVVEVFAIAGDICRPINLGMVEEGNANMTVGSPLPLSLAVPNQVSGPGSMVLDTAHTRPRDMDV